MQKPYKANNKNGLSQNKKFSIEIKKASYEFWIYGLRNKIVHNKWKMVPAVQRKVWTLEKKVQTVNKKVWTVSKKVQTVNKVPDGA